MWAATLYEHPVPPLQWGAVLGASLAAAVFDARARRIPNLLTFPLCAAGLGTAIAVGGWAGAADAVAACIVLALPFVLLFVFAGGGAGDAKLMGALGTWLGIGYGTFALMLVCLSGIVMAFAYSHARGRSSEVLTSVCGLAKGALGPVFGSGSFRDVPGLLPPVDQGQKMPYGLAICAGMFLAAGGSLLWHP